MLDLKRSPVLRYIFPSGMENVVNHDNMRAQVPVILSTQWSAVAHLQPLYCPDQDNLRGSVAVCAWHGNSDI